MFSRDPNMGLNIFSSIFNSRVELGVQNKVKKQNV